MTTRRKETERNTQYSLLYSDFYPVHIILKNVRLIKSTYHDDQHSFTTGNSVIGIVRHIGIADNFRRLLKSIDNFSFRCSDKCGRCLYKVVVVLAKLTLFVQS